jgi:TamB, inner membrane protein subunit of TAM complex
VTDGPSELPETPAPDAQPVEQPLEQIDAPVRQKGVRRAAIRRWVKRGVLVVSAIVATLLVTIITVDLGRITVGGRSLVTVAESQGSNYLKRPLHIGSIKALVWTGEFALDDVVIDGPFKDSRPFFAAKRITVNMPWWTMFSKELYIDLRIYDWKMTIENWADGAHLPRLKPESKPNQKPLGIKVRRMDIYAHRGEFVFDDHANNWSIVAPNLNFALVKAGNLGAIVGNAAFSEGSTRIQDHQPMRTNFKTWFRLNGGIVNLRHIDLETDGSRSHVDGFVDFANWPVQEYHINSEVDFAKMRKIFFGPANWDMSGDGQFTGVFKFFKNGRDLSGEFRSEEAGLRLGKSEWRFPDLHGDLSWTPTQFVVRHADSQFLGGQMRLDYKIAPLGTKEGSTSTLGATYEDVDLYRFTRQFDWTALEPQGRMHGRVSMAWPTSAFGASMEGKGDTVIVPIGNAVTAASTLSDDEPRIPPEPSGELFAKIRPYGPFALAGDMSYRFTSDSLDFDRGWAATPTTYVVFSGHARGGPVNVPFHVTSHDWQDSDRLFTAIMNNFGSQVAAIPVGGRGTFDGALTKAFNAPRIEGTFTGDRMHAWDVDWGRASGDIAIENGYMEIKNGKIEHESGGRVVTNGRYALGYPRPDGGEEINAHVHVENMPLVPLRKAFQLDDWPMDGTVESADMVLTGKYEQPGGAGEMKLANGTAWEEPFDTATARLVFKGNGSLEVNQIVMEKGAGRIRGNALVDWEQNRYGFHAETEAPGIPMQALKNFQVEAAPLTGQLMFTADGDGSFDEPSWTVIGNVTDLYAGDEGIGPVRGRITMNKQDLRIEELVIASDRLNILGSGTIRMDEREEANLSFTFRNTSIDPYLKYVVQDFPYSKAVASGSVTVTGPLAFPKELSVTATVTDAALTLFAHAIQNEGDLVLVYDKNVFKLASVNLKGQGTSLKIQGSVDAGARTSDVHATGEASLALLSAFYPALTAEGNGSLKADLTGSFDKLNLTGQAVIKDGRLKHESMPQSITAINGPIEMAGGKISVEGLTAVLGEGDIGFHGAIILDGYQPVSYDLSAAGNGITLRYPEGLQSRANVQLFLQGPIKSPMLSGTVDVYYARYAMRVDPTTGYFDFLSGSPVSTAAVVQLPPATSTTPIGLDIEVRTPQPVAFIDTKNSVMSGTADVSISGTLDRPIILGRLTLDRGEWKFGGNRYQLTRGSIDFSPLSAEPFFDLEARTHARTTGQSYDVTLHLTGTKSKFDFNISSEPNLPEFLVISLLLGETPDVGSAEALARGAPQDLQNRAVSQAAGVLMASPFTATVGTVVERATGINTQIVPVLLGGDPTLQQLNPTARVTLGYRLSPRVYLTYSRTLSNVSVQQNEIILIEFDQNDQISWLLSRNEDRSFALDFRIRHVFK